MRSNEAVVGLIIVVCCGFVRCNPVFGGVGNSIAISMRAADGAAPSYPDWAAAVVPAYPHALPWPCPNAPQWNFAKRTHLSASFAITSFSAARPKGPGISICSAAFIFSGMEKTEFPWSRKSPESEP
jgi:hypothetical protein